MSVFYTCEYQIEDYMCDKNSILFPSYALKLVQSASLAHCRQMGAFDKISSRGQVFLITKQLCNFERPIKSGEKITLKTAPTEIVRGIFPRITYFIAQNGEQIGFCDARWFLFDVNKKRPLRKLDDDVEYTVEKNIPAPPIVFPNDQMEFLREETVRYTQIDTNGHLNNTEYLNYLSDTLQDCFVKKFQIAYKKEILSGTVKLEMSQNGNVFHMIGSNFENKNFEILAEVEDMT